MPIVCYLLVQAFFYLSAETAQRLEYINIDRLFVSRYNPTQQFSSAVMAKESFVGTDPLVIVAVDRKTLDEMPESPYFKDERFKGWNLASWPFDRRVIAEAINIMKDMKAAVIGLDILFPLPGKEEETTVLATAIAQANNVVLAALFEETGDNNIVYRQPYPTLISENTGVGFVNVPPDTDGILRKIQLRHVESPDKNIYPFFLHCWQKFPLNANFELSKATVQGNKLIIPAKVAGLEPKELYVFPDHTKLDKMLINYRGPANSFTTVSFSDLFSLEQKEHIARLIKNRIVLVGVTHSGLQDIYMTPFYSYNQKWTAGVECHANAISTALNTNASIKRSNGTINFLLYFIIASLLCAATIFGRISYSFFTLIFMVLSLAVSSYVSFIYNYYFSFFIPLLALLFSYVSIITIRMVAREKEKSTIRQVFNQYVSNQVVEQLLLHPENLSLGGKSLEISTIFSDVRGFTPLSESRTPEEVVSILNTYFELMVAIITKYRGTINKFIGDAIMILYGAPVIEGHSPKEMAHNAVRTAIEMQETMKSTSDPCLKLIKIGIGITTGFSVVGNIGASKHKDYTAIGDKINLAARLESKAPPYEILVDEQTYLYCKDSFTFEKMEPFQVKGKQEIIQGYRVIY